MYMGMFQSEFLFISSHFPPNRPEQNRPEWRRTEQRRNSIRAGEAACVPKTRIKIKSPKKKNRSETVLFHRQQTNGHRHSYLWAFVFAKRITARRSDAERFTFADRVFYCLTLFSIKRRNDCSSVFPCVPPSRCVFFRLNLMETVRERANEYLSFIYVYDDLGLLKKCVSPPLDLAYTASVRRWTGEITQNNIKMSTGKGWELELTVNNMKYTHVIRTDVDTLAKQLINSFHLANEWKILQAWRGVLVEWHGSPNLWYLFRDAFTHRLHATIWWAFLSIAN